MQITEIHIDGFGVFANRHITGLTKGINIIFGENEFGKSTLLEFIRRILFGFPRNLAAMNPYPPLQGGGYGGRLICRLDDGRMINITRASGPYGGRVTLMLDTLRLNGQDSVNNVLSHITRTFYENVYAFGLDEIQAVQSLQRDEVLSFIYGAGLGLGSVSLNEIKNGFRTQAEAIYKSRGSTQKLPVILNDIRKLEKQIHEIQKGLSYYDDLSSERESLLIEIDQMDKQIVKLAASQSSLENRHKLYPHYLELINAESELSLLDEVSSFPEDALDILKEMRMGVIGLEKRIDEEYRIELNVLTLKNDNLTYNKDLLEQESIVNSLQRLSEKYRSALNDLGPLQTEKERLAQRIGIEIEAMGGGWSEELVENFRLTPFQNDKILSFKEGFEKAKSRIDRIESKLEHHRELKAAKTSESLFGAGIYRFAFYSFTIIGLIGIFAGSRDNPFYHIILNGLFLFFPGLFCFRFVLFH